MKSISIGLLGAGNVGGGVVRILEENRESIERRLGASVRVKRVLVRDLGRERDVDVPPDLLTTDAEQVLADPDVRVVVELIGGIEPARSYVLDAIRRGKHVVTANKALLGQHGSEIFGEATRCGVSVFFEASVAGGIPILRSLREGLASDEIQRLWGIVNGTSNYILDAMARGGSNYDDALAAAQAAGYAEADPRADVDGIDAAQKLALLALVSFGIRVDPAAIPTEGITRIRPFEHQMARELGYVVKSVATARADPDGLMLAVFPAMVPRGSLLADVRGSYNALLVESHALGRSLYYGRGAGMMPTGTAVVSDIIEVCRGLQSFAEGRPPPQAFERVEEGTPKSLLGECSENYLCAHVPNVPGVLGRVASCLGEHGVSIQRMNQDTPGDNEPVDMVILTEAVEESKLQAAMQALDRFDDVLAPTHRLRILPPDPLD
ncbi:MAG: homoserine dehydrogenase [Myxococcota bacterium]